MTCSPALARGRARPRPPLQRGEARGWRSAPQRSAAGGAGLAGGWAGRPRPREQARGCASPRLVPPLGIPPSAVPLARSNEVTLARPAHCAAPGAAVGPRALHAGPRAGRNPTHTQHPHWTPYRRRMCHAGAPLAPHCRSTPRRAPAPCLRGRRAAPHCARRFAAHHPARWGLAHPPNPNSPGPRAVCGTPLLCSLQEIFVMLLCLSRNCKRCSATCSGAVPFCAPPATAQPAARCVDSRQGARPSLESYMCQLRLHQTFENHSAIHGSQTATIVRSQTHGDPETGTLPRGSPSVMRACSGKFAARVRPSRRAVVGCRCAGMPEHINRAVRAQAATFVGRCVRRR